MIYKESQIKELYDLKHRNDNELHTHYDYETNFVKKMFSKYIYRNDDMNSFLDYFRKLSVWMIESVLPIRNFFNFTSDKYWNGHSD